MVGKNLGEGYIEIRPETGGFEKELASAISRAIDKAVKEVSRGTEKIVDEFETAAKEADRLLSEIDGDDFARLEAEAKKTGETISAELREAARESDDALAGIDGDDFTRLEREAAEAGKKIGDDLEGAAKRTDNAFASLAKSAAFAAASTAILRFAKGAIDAFADLGETLSKAQVIFGDATDEIVAFGDDAANALGQSKQAAIAAASDFAIFGKAAGLSGQQLSKFSIDLTKLASDLASFSNTSPEDAVLALGAALRGESEPIRRYGVLLNDQVLKQRAVTMGIFDGTGALTAQQRVLAAQAEIFAQTTLAQGDFARTSDSLANQQKILAAEFKNLQTEIGEGLAPVFRVLVEIAGDVLGFFSALPTGVQAAGAVALIAGSAFLAASNAIQSLGVAASTANVYVAAIGATLALAVGVYKVFKDRNEQARQAQERLNAIMEASNAPSIQLTNNLEAISTAYKGLTVSSEAGADGMTNMADATRFTAGELASSLPILSRFGATAEDLAGVLETGTDEFDDLASTLDRFGGNVAVSTTRYVDDLSRSIMGAVDEANPLRQSLLDLVASGEMTTQEFKILVRSLDDTADAFDDQVNKQNEVNRAYLESGDAIATYSDILGEDVYLALLENADATAEAAGRTDEFSYLAEQLTAKLQALGVTVDPVTGEVSGLEGVLRNADGSARGFAQANDEVAASAQMSAEALEKQYEAMKKLEEALLASFNLEIRVAQQKREVNDAINEYNALQQSVIDGTYSGSDAFRDLAEAEEQVYLETLSAAQAVADLAVQQAIAKGATEESVNTNGIMRAELQKVADSLAPNSPLRRQLQQYIDGLNSIKPEVNTNVTTTYRSIYLTADAAERAAQRVGARANGGIVTRPEISLIGEAGPEAIIPLSRPARAVEILRQAGLDGLMGSRGPAVAIQNAVFADQTDVELVAQKVNAAERARSFSQ